MSYCIVIILLSGKTNNVVKDGLKARINWVLTHSHPNKSYFNIALLVHFLLWQAAKPSGDKCTPLKHRPPSDRIPFAVQSDCVRRPIRLRPPSNRIPSAVRSDCVRLRTTFRDVLPTMKYCTHAYLLLFNRLYSWYITRFVLFVPLWATKRA